MRVCILTQYFPPEMGAPQARLSELAERLIDVGWQVEVLTALPNYPTGKVFSGYDSTAPLVTKIGRIPTVRVPLYCAKQGFVKRLRCYFSFVASARRHGPELCQRPDVLFVESPPLFIGYAARYLAKRWACPYVFNVSDIWPESAIRMGVVKAGLLTWMAERLELSLYRHARGITGQSSEIIESIQRRSGHPRTEVITNGVECARFGPSKADDAARDLLGRAPGPIFLYAGLLGLAQGLDQILDLAKSLSPSVPGRFVLVGEGPERERLKRRVETESIGRVTILESQPRERIPALLAAADAAFITLGMSIPGAVPSKIYEAMASSLPVLLIADGEAANRIKSARCGLTVNPGASADLRAAFEKLASDPALRRQLGEAGRTAAETLYDRKQIATRLDQFLKRCLQKD